MAVNHERHQSWMVHVLLFESSKRSFRLLAGTISFRKLVKWLFMNKNQFLRHPTSQINCLFCYEQLPNWKDPNSALIKKEWLTYLTKMSVKKCRFSAAGIYFWKKIKKEFVDKTIIRKHLHFPYFTYFRNLNKPESHNKNKR